VILAGLGACARDLKDDLDLSSTPTEFDQKIVETEIETLQPPTPLVLEKTKRAAKAGTSKGAAKSAVAPKKASSPVEAVAAKPMLTRIWPISVGEKSAYNLRWGVIEGGVVKIEVLPPQNLDGTPALHYFGTVKSSKMMDLFYKIDNRIDTWVRISDLAPLRQEIKQNESARWGRRVMMIDPDKSEVKFYEHLTKAKGGVQEDKRIDKMVLGAQDIFGALYFYRFVQNVGENYKFPIHDKGKNWFAELKFEDRETLRIPAGVFEARRYKVAPRLEGQLQPKGDVVVWVSDDDRALLLKFSAKIKVGSITGELIEHSAGKAISLALPVPLTPVEEVAAAVAAQE
jgi:hypothetical protein